MAWQQTVTSAGLELLAGAFGKTPNITRVALGSGSVLASELQEQTDVTGFVKDLAITGITSSGSRSILRAQLTNAGLAAPTLLTQLGVFARLDDGAEALLVIFQNDTPSTIPAPGQQAGYSFETEMQIAHANVASFTANIDWGAYASISQLNDSVNSAVADAMSVYGDLFGPPAPIKEFWTRTDGDGNKLRPAGIESAKRAILGEHGEADISLAVRKLEYLENAVGEVLLTLEAQSIYPDYVRYIIEDFKNPGELQVDLTKTAVTSIVAGDRSFEVNTLDGIIPWSWYTLSDGMNAERVCVKSCNTENGIRRVIITAPIQHTYLLSETRLYRSSATVRNGAANGPIGVQAIKWDAGADWRGQNADTPVTFRLPTNLANAGKFTFSDAVSFTPDGLVTLTG